MANATKKPSQSGQQSAKPRSGGTKPVTKPKPTPKAVANNNVPKATVPPQFGPQFSRPMGASVTQRSKRREARGNAKVGRITARVNGSVGEIEFYGTIGEDFWGEGITGSWFRKELKALGDVDEIVILANSGGGDVFEATSIYNQLIKHPAKVTVVVEGVAASAMTLIAMAGDEIHMAENAYWMIHAASGVVWGNARQIRDYLQLLDNADDMIRLTYAKRTGLSTTELVEMMDHDNWMTAAEAMEYGFIDAIDEAKETEAHASPENVLKFEGPAEDITDEQLAAMAEQLETLAANIGQPKRLAASAKPDAKPTPSGNSPQPVTPPQEEEPEMKMSAKLRAKCVAAGMSKDLDDAAAWAWYDEHEDAVLDNTSAGDRADWKKGLSGVADPDADKTTNGQGGLSLEDIDAFIERREAKRAEQRASFCKQVDNYISLAFGNNGDKPAELVAECYGMQEQGIDAVQTKILEVKNALDEAAPVGSVGLSHSQPRDRHLAAVQAGFLVRTMRNFATQGSRLQQIDGRWERVAITPESILEKQLPEKDRPKDWERFSRLTLLNLCNECLIIDGFSPERVRHLSPMHLAMAAMGYNLGQFGLRASAAYHTTGSLLEVTRDAVNKSLLAGYGEAPQTWRGPMRQADSVPDFKQIHRVKLSAGQNLPVWPDNTAPNQAKLSSEEETYAVEARAETLSFSWRLVLNDDLDALSRRPQLLGDAAARTVNAVAWQAILANPVMADGQTLFLETPTGGRFRSNLTTGSATPTNATNGAMKKKMRVMRGLNTSDSAGNPVEGSDILNLMPSFIVGPAALEEVILKQVYSGADPASGGNSAVFNTSRNLEPIIEPLLDVASENAWYLFATPSRIDTAEVTFLQGQEQPFAHEWMDNETMSQNYTIMQTCAAKAIDHRGIQKHAGQ
jgi:ATP-dependent protease ClpP protease subunit